jgi:DNA-binding NarL/FixJ family response regulator
MLVADGLSNREVAAQLYLSPKTIEYHLAHIFAKLGIRTRYQLAARVRSRAPFGARALRLAQSSVAVVAEGRQLS